VKRHYSAVAGIAAAKKNPQMKKAAESSSLDISRDQKLVWAATLSPEGAFSASEETILTQLVFKVGVKIKRLAHE
jgi:hypothetical protein